MSNITSEFVPEYAGTELRRAAARELGAVLEAVEYYPVKYQQRTREVFALRYFNQAGDEVAYFMPDTGGWTVFSRPRVWFESFKVRLLRNEQRL